MLKKTIVVNGDVLVLPELKKFQGRKVEITLKELSESEKPGKNLKEYFGILKTDEDALEFQKRVRAEWEEREKSF
jgi:hypothetical protein